MQQSVDAVGSPQYRVPVFVGFTKTRGHTVSPSCFANLQGSGNRNAWKAI
jgi:hypothetical protein